MLFKKLLHRLDLVLLHIDDKTIGRVRRQAFAPVLHQFGAHQGKQQQAHAAQAERHYLHRIAATVACQIGKYMAVAKRQGG